MESSKSFLAKVRATYWTRSNWQDREWRRSLMNSKCTLFHLQRAILTRSNFLDKMRKGPPSTCMAHTAATAKKLSGSWTHIASKRKGRLEILPWPFVFSLKGRWSKVDAGAWIIKVFRNKTLQAWLAKPWSRYSWISTPPSLPLFHVNGLPLNPKSTNP